MQKVKRLQIEALKARIDELLGEGDRSPIEMLSGPALEALGNLAAAYDSPVPHDRLIHTRATGAIRNEGEWASAGRAASVVSEIRKVLGPRSVRTVLGVGYCLGEIDWEQVL